MTLIELQDVSKSFWIPDERRDTIREHVFGAFRPRPLRELRVLQSVSLALSRGEALGLMGGNGAGKSTLLKILCGIYVADSGRVLANAAITPILELGVGWNPELDAIDNIYLMGTIMGLSLARAASRRRRDPRVRRAAAVREDASEALLQRHVGAPRLRRRFQSGPRSAGA